MMCCLVLVTPVPGAAADRSNGITPRVLVNASSGSVELNGRFAAVPFSSRWPTLWSTNWPDTLPHWVTPRSENTFALRSLNTRLETARGEAPGSGQPPQRISRRVHKSVPCQGL